MGCIIKYKGQSIPEEQFLQYLNKQIAINQLFESDSNLAHQVYEALGFRNKHWSGHTISTFNKAANEFINKFKGKFPFRIVGSAALSLNNKLDRVPNDIDLLVEDTYSSVFYGGAEINENSPKFVQEIKKVYGQTYITGGFDDVSGALLYIPELNLYIEPKFYSKEQLDSDKSLVQDVTNIKDEKKIWNEEILQITQQQKQQAQQVYSQYLEQNPNGSVEQFKSWVEEFNRNKFVQESGSLATISQSKINNLQSTIEYQLLVEQDDDLIIKGGQSYVYLNEKDASRFSHILEKTKEFPKEFKVTKKITKYERVPNTQKFNSYNEYVDFYYIKLNNNKKSNLYQIVDKKTGELIANKVRVLHFSQDSKSKISEQYGLEFKPRKVFSANRSIAFALYRQKPSKAKYVAQAKKYLYDAIKFLNPEETNLKINLDKIERLLNSFPEDMWDYINTTYSPEDSTNINASISLQKEIKFKLPKLGFLQEIEKITGIPLQGVSFKNYDRTGSLAKVFKFSKLDGEWGSTITIDSSTMTTKELKASIRYYLSTKNIFKQTSEEENVRKYAEHRGIDYDKLKELVFGDIDKALDNIAYNQTGNSDTIELSKWRESIRNYDWQSAELFSKPYENFQNTVKERITEKFKDKELSNGISHLDYFFNSGAFNWLNINFNNISGQYYESDMETEANVGVETKMGGIINPFEMKIYQKPKAGKNFLQEKEVFNRLAAVLHEPFHALHALSYGTKEEIQLRKAFDDLYSTDFGKEMMNQVFGSGYNKGQQVSYDTLYKEFTAFTTQLMLYPKQWIKNTDLRSNDIYEFIEKIQNLQDKTYTEIVKTQQKIGTIEKTITEEEKIKLSFLEKLYNYLVKALNKIIPLSKKFTNLIVDSKLVEKKVIEDVFGEVEETVTKTLKLPDNVKKSKEQFLEAMEELQSAINTLMQIDGKLFSSENITNFFTSNKFNQEQRSLSNFISQKSQENNSFQQFQQSLNNPNTNPILQGNQQEQVKKFAELQERLNNKEFLEGAKNAFESSEELQQFGTQEQYNDYIARVSLGIIKNPTSGEYNYESKVQDIVYHGSLNKIETFDKSRLGSFTKAASAKEAIFFTGNIEVAKTYAVPKNLDETEKGRKLLEEFDISKITPEEDAKYGLIDMYKKQLSDFEDDFDFDSVSFRRGLNKIKGWKTGTNYEYYSEVYPSILNLKNPKIKDFESKPYRDESYFEIQVKAKEYNNDGTVLKNTFDGRERFGVFESDIYTVFEPEQIHVLSSKADIEGFKDFVQGKPNNVKLGVKELFNENPELVNVGTQEQYSQYLDTIFPDSKVKDIVYHGTLDKIESFDKSKIGKNTIKDRPKGFYFTRKNVAENIYGSYPTIDNSTGEQILQKGNLISAIINTKGQYELVQEKDDISGYGDFVEYPSHVVFEPEQIHILGSKQDIEGFKKFVEQPIIEEIKEIKPEGLPSIDRTNKTCK